MGYGGKGLSTKPIGLQGVEVLELAELARRKSFTNDIQIFFLQVAECYSGVDNTKGRNTKKKESHGPQYPFRCQKLV